MWARLVVTAIVHLCVTGTYAADGETEESKSGAKDHWMDSELFDSQLEESLPDVHRSFHAGEWVQMQGFAKYDLMAKRLRERWGSTDTQESVLTLTQLEGSLTGDANDLLNARLGEYADFILFHYVHSEWFLKDVRRFTDLVNEYTDKLPLESKRYLACQAGSNQKTRQCGLGVLQTTESNVLNCLKQSEANFHSLYECLSFFVKPFEALVDCRTETTRRTVECMQTMVGSESFQRLLSEEQQEKLWQ